MHSSIIRVIEKTLNYVDPRLIDHGKRVAYLTYKVLKLQGKDPGYIRKLSILALLHDIGAYKTEEIDNMVQFETDRVWEHSVYGYLFIKHFSPLAGLAPVLLFHHATCDELNYLHPCYREAAQIIHVADRFDILSQTSSLSRDAFRRHFDERSGSRFDPEVVTLFFYPGWEGLFDALETDKEFETLLYDGELTEAEVRAFVEMIVLSIDFRSPQTVTHTLTSTCVCRIMSELIDMESKEKDNLYTGVMFHDLGKVGIPSRVLEKTGRLDDTEMEIMKRHVEITERILSGFVDDCSLQLSVRHHEKLDGTGYPRGLRANDLSKGQRLIAVADIFSALVGVRSYKESYPKSKVVGILQDMSDKALIDPDIVATLVAHYETLTGAVEKTTRPILNAYEALLVENSSLLERVRGFSKGVGTGLIAV